MESWMFASKMGLVLATLFVCHHLNADLTPAAAVLGAVSLLHAVVKSGLHIGAPDAVDASESEQSEREV